MATAESKTFPYVLLPRWQCDNILVPTSRPPTLNFRAPLHQAGSRALPRHRGQFQSLTVMPRVIRVILLRKRRRFGPFGCAALAHRLFRAAPQAFEPEADSVT